jgi:hypothetical protein
VLGRLTVNWPFYPVAAGAASIVTLHINAAAPAEVLVRPLVIATGAVILVQAAVWIATRNGEKAAFLALLVVTALLVPMAALALASAGGITVVIALAKGHREFPLAQVTRFLNIAVPILLAIASMNAAFAGSFTSTVKAHASIQDVTQGSPDIYLILLDAYPRDDTLLADFGIDNEPFLQEMERLGFTISRQSRANYNMTLLTLASMFSYQPVLELPRADASVGPLEQHRAMSRSINEGVGLGELRDRGYEIVAISSPSDVTALYSADRVIDPGGLSTFEYQILHRPLMRLVLPGIQRSWLAEQHRSHLRNSIASLYRLVGEQRDRPRLVFAHILAPHPPLLIGPQGQEMEPFGCFPLTCELWDGGSRQGLDAVAPALEAKVSGRTRR